jgi:hypothetical protein
MAYLSETSDTQVHLGQSAKDVECGSCEALVIVVADGTTISEIFRKVCECLDVIVERIPSQEDLNTVLRHRRPMAVVAEMDAVGQDGCHVLMTIADYDRELPVLLITGGDPSTIGAIDAVEEIWHLVSVVKWDRLPGVGAIVEFLCRAGRRGNCMRLMLV